MSQEATIELKRKVGIANNVLGMAFFIATEVMFFSGLIAAYIVNRINSNIAWPPPGQPRLPQDLTAVNTVILLLSSVTLLVALRYVKQLKFEKIKLVKTLLIATFVLGCIFLTIQGYEWSRLIGFGLTTNSSLFGSFFYTIIGAHGLHVVVGLIVHAILSWRVLKGFEAKKDMSSLATTGGIYWYFVVYVWPVIYILVYLL